jgi:glyoxylase-like metal-dependent hydrolase (beta-lactamase superfamily II)
MGISVEAFFDKPTFTITYVAWDEASKKAIIVDSVMDYDSQSGKISYQAADLVIDFVKNSGLDVVYIMETHVHADHMTSAPYLRDALGGEVCISTGITAVQEVFGPVFNAGSNFACDGSQFDRLLADGDKLPLGEAEISIIHTPGHTPACITIAVGDVAFVGDTIFMPDFGSARTDFPKGDARTLYQSVQKILALAPETKLYVGHDYAPGERDYEWETTVSVELAENIHLKAGTSEDDFVSMREARDKELAVPKLLLPAIQVNINAGALPQPENNGTRYLKIPLS